MVLNIINIFSQISSRSGTTTVIGLKRALRPSGSSERPRYPGFIVMKAQKVGLILIKLSSKVISGVPLAIASKSYYNY